MVYTSMADISFEGPDMMAGQWLLLAGATAFLACLASTCFRREKPALVLAALGSVAIAAALFSQLVITGRVPWASLYETAALLALILGLLLVLATLRQEPPQLRLALAAIPVVLLLFSALAWASPAGLSESLESRWLLIHVPAAIAAYGLFTCAAASSVTYLYCKARRRAGEDGLQRLDRMAVICTMAGEALLIAAIAMGSLWANAAWGSYWSWDPKETWSLITALIYGLYLLLRWRGLKGEDAAYLSIVGLACVMFTYLGVSYVIPGLHSYA